MRSIWRNILPVVFLFLMANQLYALRTYTGIYAELIITHSQVKFNDDFMSVNPGNKLVGTHLRYTIFMNIRQAWNIDFSGNIGLLTGAGLQNIGIITDEVLSPRENNYHFTEYKIIRRVYTVGIPLMLKLGSFKDDLWVYGGAEAEFAFHFKEKYWSGSHRRQGEKTVNNSWFSEQTPLFMPSLQAGIQIPKGLNIRIKYYLTDFFNSGYLKSTDATGFSISDLNRYKTSPLISIILSWQLNVRYKDKKELIASYRRYYSRDNGT